MCGSTVMMVVSISTTSKNIDKICTILVSQVKKKKSEHLEAQEPVRI
jgi:hypothetical protein